MPRLEEIIEKAASYSSSVDTEVIKKAYVFSGVVHQGQTRLSGEPYLTHPLEVANILTGLKMDAQCVATGLLHDTVEDTFTTIEKIEELFGPEIAGMVDGLTKISRMTFESKEDNEAENFRKMILAISKDIRVLLIKLADRLHNMRTLDALSPERQTKIAKETIDIYAPLANRLGIGWIKTELEELSFKYLEPEKYAWLRERVAMEKAVRQSHIDDVRKVIEEKLAEHKIAAEVSGRLKHLYSIYTKMKEQEVEFDNINDVIAFRIIVKSVSDCYAVLGIIHAVWKPVPGRFKDYIALPKLNLYQSLHTTVVGPFGVRMEVQIRTEEMHRVAEYGIAAHWKYKEGKLIVGKDDKSFAWLRQLLEYQNELKDSDEFMESLKVDLFPEEVFVFTPKGAIKQLPSGSTPVDFAYAIHTDIGNQCAGAKVNGRMVPLKTRLRNGDVVEIISSAGHKPSTDWLKFAVSSKAKTRIRQWIKAEDRSTSISLGREILEKEMLKHSIEFGKLVKSGELEKIAKDGFSLQSADALIASVGYGKLSVKQVLGKFLPPEKLVDKPGQKFSIMKMFDKLKGAPKPGKSPVIVRGVEDVLVKFAKCCNPLPGDGIAGFLTHGQGVAIHAKRCPNLMNIEKDRLIDVAWDTKTKTTRPVRIEVVCKNEKGALADMTHAIKAADANIASAEIKTDTVRNLAVCTFDVEVSDSAHLNAIIKSLKKLKKVVKAERVSKDTSRGEHEDAV